MSTQRCRTLDVRGGQSCASPPGASSPPSGRSPTGAGCCHPAGTAAGPGRKRTGRLQCARLHFHLPGGGPQVELRGWPTPARRRQPSEGSARPSTDGPSLLTWPGRKCICVTVAVSLCSPVNSTPGVPYLKDVRRQGRGSRVREAWAAGAPVFLSPAGSGRRMPPWAAQGDRRRYLPLACKPSPEVPFRELKLVTACPSVQACSLLFPSHKATFVRRPHQEGCPATGLPLGSGMGQPAPRVSDRAPSSTGLDEPSWPPGPAAGMSTSPRFL